MSQPDSSDNFGNLLAFAEEANSELGGGEQGVWLNRLEAEHGRLCALLSQSIDRQDAATALRLCAALQTFWRLRGHFEEGLQLSASALEIGDASNDLTWRASVLNGIGVLARMQGDYSTARNCHKQSLANRLEIGDKPGMASSCTGLGNVLSAEGDYAAACACYEQSMAIKVELGDRQGVGGSLNNLGYTAYRQGDYMLAQRYYEQSLEIWRTYGNLQYIALSLQGFAEVSAMRFHWKRAVQLWAAADAFRRQSGAELSANEQQALDRDLSAARHAIGGERFDTAWHSGAAMTVDEAVEYALALPRDGCSIQA